MTAPEPQAVVAAVEPSQPEPVTLGLEEFIAAESEAPSTLIGTDDDCILPAHGLGLLGGKPYVGKTTLAIDFGFHLASGVEWLGLPVPRPLRVLLLENEGPREPFRRKIERKLAAWPHEIKGTLRFSVLNWGSFTLADSEMRAKLRTEIEHERIDAVIGDPLGSLGMEGVGSPAETRAFVSLLREAGLYELAAWFLLHHFRKEPTADEIDQLSGAWGPHADTILVLKGDSGDRARLSFPKVRWGTYGRPALILSREMEAQTFAVVAVEERAGDRDLDAEIAALLADDEPRTLTEIKAPKKDGGIGANRENVEAVLRTNPDRFRSVRGEQIGRKPQAEFWVLAQGSVQVVQEGLSAGGSAPCTARRSRSACASVQDPLDLGRAQPGEQDVKTVERVRRNEPRRSLFRPRRRSRESRRPRTARRPDHRRDARRRPARHPRRARRRPVGRGGGREWEGGWASRPVPVADARGRAVG